MDRMMTVLAALVFAFHLSWYVWMIFGALWTRNRPLLTGLHVLSLAWGIVVQVGPWPCPLTVIEQLLRSTINGHAYASSFALHYLELLVNPRVSYSITVIGALIVCGVNLSIYLVRLIKALEGRRQKLAMSLVTVAIVFMGGLLLRQAPVYGKLSPGLLHRFLRAAVTGSDGSQTGIASFQGNFTSISVPGIAVGLSRQADCSLTLLNGDYSIGSLSFTQTVVSTNYERVLHSAAGLTTTPGIFASGCSSSNTGISTRPVVFAGKTTSGIDIFAAVSYNPITGNNAVYTMNLNTSSISTQDVPAAGALTTADLNGDGNGDLVIVNNVLTSAGSVSVMLGNADGSFQTAVSYATAGAGAIAAVIDDVNNDGKLDIIVASDDQQISVLTGKGDGTFNSAQSFSAPLPGSALPIATPIKHLITADINGDGKKDIICSNGLVLLGNGDGTFTASSTVAFPYVIGATDSGPNLASGDLNKDGNVDLVLATGTNISTWLGKGDGTFVPGNAYASISNSGYVAVTDLDGDGNLDIYSGVANGGYYGGDDSSPATSYALMGTGNGTFVGAPSVPGYYNGSNIGDVNGDGYPDEIVPTSGTVNGQTAVFTVELGTANGTFTPASTITVPLSVTFTVSEFTSPVTEFTSNLTPASYVVGDINGDGKPDVAYVSNYRGYAVYFIALNNGDGTFAPAAATGFPQIAAATGFDISTTINNLRIGDFNHDGKADLLFNFDDVTGQAGPGIYLQGIGVLPGNGDGTFGAAPALTYSYNSGTAPTSLGIPSVSFIGDLNGDGYPDLIATNSSYTVVNGVGVASSTILVYLGKVDGTFAAPTMPITSGALGQFTVADFNKDGKLDIAALTETTAGQAQLSIALGNGDGSFAAPVISNLLGGDAIRSAALASADFDGDGNVDLALFDSNDFSGVFYGKGDGTFTSVPFNGSIIPKDLVSLDAAGLAVALDMNKDGKPDVIVGSTVLLNLYGVGPIAPKYASTAALTTSATTITAGSNLTLTATITGASGSPAAPSGTVTFLDGTTTLGMGTLASGVATLTTSTLAVGTHSISVTYGGDANFTGSNSSAATVTVTTVAAVATTTALAASPTTGVTGTTITLTATVTSAPGTTIPTGTVTFLDGTTSLGMSTLDATGKGTFSTSALAVGTHTITANYPGGAGFAASTSSAVSVSITLPIPDFALTISPSSGTETTTSPASATVSVTPANGFNSAVSFACSGLPAGVTCSFNPPTVTPAGAVATTTVSFAGATSAANRGPLNHYVPETVLAIGLGAWLLTRRRINKLSVGLWTVLLATALLNLAGCGSSGPKTTTSAVTITATSGTLSHTTNYSLATTK